MKSYTTYYQTPAGLLQLQCSDEYIYEVGFVESRTTDDQQHTLLQQCCTQLHEYFSGERTEFSLPVKQTGTAFQQKVWDLLLDISFGKTMSYHQLAVQYGDVKAIRAVAAANGKNRLAIIIPCHRVIGSNGTLTGYAGGLQRKKWLLDHEAAWYSGVQQLPFSYS